MAFPSQKETYDSNTPSDLSNRKSMNEALHRRSSKLASKGTKIQSYRRSISNSSVHTTSTVVTREVLFDCSEQGPGGVPSISHRKSLHSLEKPTFHFRNQSQSTVGTIREAGSVRSSTTTSTLKQEIRSLNVPSFQGEDESPLPPTPRSSVYNLSSLPEPSPSSSRVYGVPPSSPLDDPSTKPDHDGDHQPFATTEIHTDDKPPARHPSSLPPPTDRMGTTSLSLTVPPSKEATSSVSGTVTNHKVYDTSSPSARTPKITVEYHKPPRQSIEEYKEFLRNANMHAAAAASSYKDPFVPSTQAPHPPSSHDASKSSRGQQNVTSSVPATPPHSFQMNRVNLADSYPDPNPMAALGTAPTAPLDGLSEVSLSPMPADDIMGITLRSRGDSVTAKGKKGMLGFVTDFLNPPKRPEISTAYDPVHLMHVGPNSSTGEFTGFPKEIVTLHRGGGDVWDKMGHAPVQGISLPPPIPGVAPAAHPGAPKSVDASAEGSRNSLNAEDSVRSQATVASNGTVAERPAPQPPTAPQQRSAAVASLAKAASATPRRREKKKEDKANDADLVRRLQQICTDTDPTRLYRNLVKIGQG
jgi:hypothetical protein